MFPPIVHDLLMLGLGLLAAIAGWAIRDLYRKVEKVDDAQRAAVVELGQKVAVLEHAGQRMDHHENRIKTIEDQISAVVADVKVSREILEELRARVSRRKRSGS